MSRLIAVLLLCATPLALRATVIAPAEFREVVNGADVIAYGQVVDTLVEPAEDRLRVGTLVTLRVGTYLKGDGGETLVFRVPGGRVGRYRTVMVGAPRFARGDEAVVFLRTAAGAHPTIVGLNQGVFRVRLDEVSRRRVVVPAPVLARSSTPERVVRGAAARRPVALEAFGAQVQSVLAEESARGAR